MVRILCFGGERASLRLELIHFFVLDFSLFRLALRPRLVLASPFEQVLIVLEL